MVLEKQMKRPVQVEMLFSWIIWCSMIAFGTAAVSLGIRVYFVGFACAWPLFSADPFMGHSLLAIPGAIIVGSSWQALQIMWWSLSGGMGASVARAFGARKVNWNDIQHQSLLKRVSILGARAGLPDGCPELYIAPNREANAFAAGFSPRDSVVAVTEGLLEDASLTREEMDAVLAHEIGHIRNGDCRSGIQLGIMVAGFSSLLSMGIHSLDFFSRSGSSSSSKKNDNTPFWMVGIGMVCAGGLLYLMGYLLQSWHSRRCEFAADEAAVALTGSDALGSALAKIERTSADDTSSMTLPERKPQFAHLCITNHNKGFFEYLSGLLRSHPHTEDRRAAIRRTLRHISHV